MATFYVSGYVLELAPNKYRLPTGGTKSNSFFGIPPVCCCFFDGRIDSIDDIQKDKKNV